VNGWLFVAGVYAGAAVVFGSVFALFRILAWVCTNGLPAMLRLRGRAVVEWPDTEAWDEHVDAALQILLTHEATPGVVCGTPERWMDLEEEFADLNELAEQLGERAQ
jgi:hypothetical protein